MPAVIRQKCGGGVGYLPSTRFSFTAINFAGIG